MRGIYTALITPFNDDGSIDEKALRTIVDMQIEGGVQGLVPMGTTGESPTVDHHENIEVVRMVVEQANGRVPVIAGTGSNSTKEAVDMTMQAKKIGATATLQVAPYYNKPSQEGFYRHFTTVADEGGLPVVVYNIPGRSGRNIEASTLHRLAAHPQIVAIKEANGDFAHIMKLMHHCPDGLAVLSGNDETSILLTLLGGQGVVSVASNVAPKMMCSLIQAALKGDVNQAREEHFRMLPLFDALFVETNPLPVKYAMHALGYCKEVYRLPLCPLSQQLREKIDSVLAELQPC